MRTALVLLLFVVALPACDSAPDGAGPPDGPAPPDGPEACGPLTTHADTLLVRVGETVQANLDTLTERSDLVFDMESSHVSATVERSGDRGQILSVSGARRGAEDLVLSGRAACGVAERVVLRLLVVAADADCSTAPSVNALGPLRVAAGGLPEDVPLWSEGGLFTGSFDALSGFTVEATPGLRVSVVSPPGGGPRNLRFEPTSTASTPAQLTVHATDACYRTATATFDVEVVDSPVCALIDPTWVDYLPWEVGDSFRMRDRLNAVTEDWTIRSLGTCASGGRSIEVDVHVRPDVGSPSSRTRYLSVLGNSVHIDLPYFYGYVQRMYPPTTPDSIRAASWGYGGGVSLTRARGLVDLKWIERGPGSGNYVTRSFWQQL